jgi:hypothetical protein
VCWRPQLRQGLNISNFVQPGCVTRGAKQMRLQWSSHRWASHTKRQNLTFSCKHHLATVKHKFILWTPWCGLSEYQLLVHAGDSEQLAISPDHAEENRWQVRFSIFLATLVVFLKSLTGPWPLALLKLQSLGSENDQVPNLTFVFIIFSHVHVA